MNEIASVISSSIPLYCSMSAVSGLLVTYICIFAVPVIFRIELRKNFLLWTAASFLSVAVGFLRPFMQGDVLVKLRIWETISLAVPYLCTLLLVPLKHVWKGFSTCLGYVFVDAPKYILLLAFFNYNYEYPVYSQEMFVELIINVIVFMLILWFFSRRQQRKNYFAPLLLLDPLFYVMIAVTFTVFVTSLLLYGSSFGEERGAQFYFMLMNLPMTAITIFYGVRSTIKAKAAEEAHKKALEQQVAHFEAMEKMNEDLRIFKHDLPKKLRPMVTYLDENNSEAAKEIAEELGKFTSSGSKHFKTGNTRLDTILFCEQQLAEKKGIEIVFPDDSAFPSDGIEADDIYSIFPNALDNAIEATEKFNGEKQIIFESKPVGNTVYVKITNPIANELKIKNGIPQTTKADKRSHGFGLKSIKKAAAKYGSDNMDFVVKNGKFSLRLSLLLFPEQRQ